MAGVHVGGREHGRALDREVEMVPFIDLLFVTIAFLLITAVWSQNAALHANAAVPGAGAICGGCLPPTPERRLHLEVEGDHFRLAWKQGDTVVSEERVERDLPALAARLTEAWRSFGSHADPADGHRDACVLHAADGMPFGELVAVIDAVYATEREYARPDGTTERAAAFDLTFAAR